MESGVIPKAMMSMTVAFTTRKKKPSAHLLRRCKGSSASTSIDHFMKSMPTALLRQPMEI